MLAKLDVRYVIAGHSERRELFGETDDQVNAKVHADPQRAAMTPILCCGETLDEREAGATEAKVDRPGPGRPRRAQRGPGRPGWWSPTSRSGPSAPAARPAPRTPRPSARLVRAVVAGAAGADAAASVRIQYGGSVKPTNAAELMAQPDIDGALVGGASLERRRLRPNRPVSSLNRHHPATHWTIRPTAALADWANRAAGPRPDWPDGVSIWLPLHRMPTAAAIPWAPAPARDCPRRAGPC